MRFDLEKIADCVEEGSSVLDIGCGEGQLLAYLKRQRKCKVRGLEIDQVKVQKAVSKGLSVMQGDADNDLEFYPKDIFDYVIMAEALQATKQPKEVLEELFKIGKKVIISIPNFGNYKNRLQLLLSGIMPVNKNISYEWYETPNIHFCTIKDFVALCNEISAKIEQEVYTVGNKKVCNFLPNLAAEKGIFVLSK